ncbi:MULTISPECIES: arginase family protein [unclassified Arthrobacter]|uniref:arginase family protein n=1 Tax=unclassified Arthrobacter TaxID=235627 RepID=UPI001E449AC7|nr:MULTISPECIES: arginase family protein [unclassified Arthrobacter]MCC9145306.1 arginase family protein [Arthrobacter sp. zg-Y919]MDK1276534.1 arginase family protein [Arthrobacter sp. zg.Y919]MDM7989176.1 arginase family protein [Arthrobacter sp. zg-Y877]WIB01873.1 arginase family protein [Arthrobacter sp. zg-Y919]
MTSMHPSGPGALRLVFPQWQGAAGAGTVGSLPAGQPHQTQLSYHLGPALLELLSPGHDGPTAYVPVSTDTESVETVNGIYARDAVLRQLRAGVRLVQEADPESVVTFGGECSVSVAPFSYLAARYGADLAVLWVDAHPDTGLPGDSYTGFRSMSLATLAGEGDAEFLAALPAVVPPANILHVGLQDWQDPGIATKRRLGIASVGITDTPEDTRRILDWLALTGASKLAVHVDLDVLDRRDFTGATGNGTRGVRVPDLLRIIDAVGEAGEIVGLSLAQHAPLELLRLGGLLRDLPV